MAQGWDIIPDNFSSGERTSFLYVEDSVRIRILSEPLHYRKHYVKVGSKGRSIKCPGEQNCVICQTMSAISPARDRYLFIVLDRSDETAKIYDAPKEVAVAIKGILKEYNSLDMDLTIKKIKGRRVGYQVLPRAPESLPPDLVQKIRNELVNIDLQRIAAPHTTEQIAAILKGEEIPPRNVQEVNAGWNTNYTQSTTVQPPQVPQQPNIPQPPQAPQPPQQPNIPQPQAPPQQPNIPQPPQVPQQPNIPQPPQAPQPQNKDQEMPNIDIENAFKDFM